MTSDRLPDPDTEPLFGCELRAVGKFFFKDATKIGIRGVTYGTFRPGPHGDTFPEPAVVERDFTMMRSAGINAFRTYVVPSGRILDAAARHSLAVLVGLPWTQHVSFLDDRRQVRRIASEVRSGVVACASHPAVMGYAVGNEIPSEIVRWSGRRRMQSFIRELYETAKQVDPETSVTYANFPPTEYLELPFLDFLAFNVYLESVRSLEAYIARLHHHAGDRPLVMTELGMDSRSHGHVRQARAIRRQVMAAERGACAGTFIFSWTDEWHRGGRDVEDWDFGLTTRERKPKPALTLLRDTLRTPPPQPDRGWPRVTVIVCAYNGAPTLGECLAGLRELAYPDFEVIVVDDGSTDATSRVAQHFDVTLIRTRNQGLSRARNTGLKAATGEIVAYIDADASPDRDWLTHLVRILESGGFEAAGGPNVAPPDTGSVAACVANAPGGPIHVMLTDRVAEHVPGCNMAFRREALEAIGGFDPRFRVAGDDVDVCWRIQQEGWDIGFAPGALVWHHPRDTVALFWRQQRGYGAAEALLEAKWPDKYNVLGHVTWGGRVYGSAAGLLPFHPGRIYGGVWGQEPYQRLVPGPGGGLWDVVVMPEWFLVLLTLAFLSMVGVFWAPMLVSLPLLIVGVSVTVARAVAGGLAAHFPSRALEESSLLRLRTLTTFLHLLQPLARLRGRFVRGLVPWRARARASRVVWPGHWHPTLWKEQGEALPSILSRLEARVANSGTAVRRGGSYDRWDLRVEGGTFGSTRLRSCVEWHGEGRQLLRFAVEPRPSRAAWWTALVPLLLGLWAVLDGAGGVGAGLVAVAMVVGLRALWECGASTAVLLDAIDGIDDVAEVRRPRPAPGAPAPSPQGVGAAG